MARPHELKLLDCWSDMLDAFNKESDRGAAVLIGGFVENFLALYLRSLVIDEKVADDLFEAVGPLSSFSQRIAVARAFGFISKTEYEDLTLIRKIRNHFAHHPLDTSFATPAIDHLVSRLSQIKIAKESEAEDDAKRNRIAYAYSCGMFCVLANERMEKRVKPAAS